MSYLRIDTRIHNGQIEVRFLAPDRGKKNKSRQLVKWRTTAWFPMQPYGTAAWFAGQVARGHVEYLINSYEIRRRRRTAA
jgi:hypothetical protein